MYYHFLNWIYINNMTQNSLKKIEKFFEEKKPIFLKKNEIILRPDQSPPGVFYIQKGSIKVYYITEDGEEKLHIIYAVGEFFPLTWIFKGTLKNVYYEALESSILRCAKKDEFLDFLKSDPDALIFITTYLAGVVNIFVERVNSLEITKAYPRFVSMLLFLAERFGIKKYGKTIINIPITHKDIANSINMTRETSSREFEKLKNKGLAGYEDRKIVINDLKKLERELYKNYERIPI